MSVVKQLFALGLLVSPCAAADASDADASKNVDVTFTNPDKYTDAAPHRGPSKERDGTLRQLGTYVEKVGGKYLTPGQKLSIEVLDLDLAGRVEWWHGPATDIRIMRNIDSPAMKVRYTLTENGVEKASGEERISDMSYLFSPTSIMNDGDPLKYEKSMLRDWLRKRFGNLNSPSS